MLVGNMESSVTKIVMIVGMLLVLYPCFTKRPDMRQWHSGSGCCCYCRFSDSHCFFTNCTAQAIGYVEVLCLLSACSADKAASCRRSCSFSRLSPSTSTFFGAPMYRLMYSIALLGRSGSSYNPTRTLVSVSKTPVFSRYFRNSSFLEPSLLWFPALLLLLESFPEFACCSFARVQHHSRKRERGRGNSMRKTMTSTFLVCKQYRQETNKPGAYGSGELT